MHILKIVQDVTQENQNCYRILQLLYRNSLDSSYVVETSGFSFEGNNSQKDFIHDCLSSGTWQLIGYKVVEYLNGYCFIEQFDQGAVAGFSLVQNGLGTITIQ